MAASQRLPWSLDHLAIAVSLLFNRISRSNNFFARVVFEGPLALPSPLPTAVNECRDVISGNNAVSNSALSSRFSSY